MGQLFVPGSKDIILTSVDRLVARNADGGLSPAAAHVILLGESAGANLAASNIIALGWRAFSGGWPAGDANNSTVIGENTFPGLADLTSGKSNALGAVTILGGSTYSAMTTSRRMAGLIAIGAGIAPDFDGAAGGGMDSTILIGNSIFKNNTLDNALSDHNVIIGHGACVRASLDGVRTQYTDSVIIGANAGPQINTLATFNGNTIIGSRAGQGMTGNGGNNVVLGAVAAPGLSSGIQNVIIGNSANLAGAAVSTVVIGFASTKGAATDGVFLGAEQSNAVTGARNIHIGRSAGDAEPSANADRLIVETVDAGNVRRGVLYGNMANGNLLVGLSTPAVDRDLPGTNLLKLLNGTLTGAAPVGGGFFYSLAGQLHWVSSGNVDTPLTPGITAAGNNTFTGTNTIASAEPRLLFSETDAAANVGLWDFDINAGVWALRTRTDADGAGTNAMAVTRGATTAISNISLANATNNPTGTWLGSGAFTFNGNLGVSSAEPRMLLTESDAGADLKLWDFDVNASVWTLRTRTDADGAGVNAIAVTRGATTAVSNIAFGNATNNPTYSFLGTGTVTFTGSSVATRFAPTGNVLSANGMYLPAANNLGFSTNSVLSFDVSSVGQVRLQRAGAGFSIMEGANCKMGVATLVAGTVVVNTTAVTATSRIFYTAQSLGTVAVPSAYGTSARTAGTSFTILASVPTDTSVIGWVMFEPS